MKKFIALALALVICSLCVACSGKTDSPTTTTTTERITTTDISQTADGENTSSTDSGDYEPETTEKTTIVENADVPEYTLSGELVKSETVSDITVKKTYTGVTKQDFVAYTELLLASGFKLKYSTFWIVEGSSALPEYEYGNTYIVVSWNRSSVVKGDMTISITRNDIDKMYQ